MQYSLTHRRRALGLHVTSIRVLQQPHCDVDINPVEQRSGQPRPRSILRPRPQLATRSRAPALLVVHVPPLDHASGATEPLVG